MPVNPAMMQALLMRMFGGTPGATPPQPPMGGGMGRPPSGGGGYGSPFGNSMGMPADPNQQARADMAREYLSQLMRRRLPGGPQGPVVDPVQANPPISGAGRRSLATPRVRDARSPQQRDMQRMQERGMAPHSAELAQNTRWAQERAQREQQIPARADEIRKQAQDRAGRLRNKARPKGQR